MLESKPQRLLRVRKDDMPCAGTEIEIRIEPATAAGWPTRVTLRQSGFGPFFDAAREIFDAHFRQIAANFHLYVERGIRVGAETPPDFGAALVQTPIGLELGALTAGGFAERCGMATGDVLLEVGGVRVHDIGELWALLARPSGRVGSSLARTASDGAGRVMTVVWARGRARMEGSART